MNTGFFNFIKKKKVQYNKKIMKYRSVQNKPINFFALTIFNKILRNNLKQSQSDDIDHNIALYLIY